MSRALSDLCLLTSVLCLTAGCVQEHAHVAAPSSAATQGSITSARASNQEAQRYNDVARSDAERIDAKASVIKKYWR
jgi:hypothetical protein